MGFCFALGAVKKWLGGVAERARGPVALALLMVPAALGVQSARAQGWATAELVTSAPGSMARNPVVRVPVAARVGAFNQTAPSRAASMQGAGNGRSLFVSYSQGNKDNCGSVALTKLVLALYGVSPQGGPFSHRVLGDGSVAVQLADGSVVTVTEQELRLAARESGMEAGAGDLLGTANLLYAVMAVRLAQARDGRGVDRVAFARALKMLGKGGDDADEDKLAPLLGFAFDDRSADNSAKEVYLLSSPLHVAFAFESSYDEHGEEASTRNFRREYRDAENDVMFRDFLETWHGPDGRPVLVRQCSEAKAGWTPGTAKWIPRSACDM